MVKRIATAAAIGAYLSMGTGPAFSEGDTAVRLAEASKSDHSHHASPAAADGAHHHDAEAAKRPVQVEFRTQPETLQADTRTELVFTLKDASGHPVEELVTHHGRKLHVVIVSEDMNVLGHVHPQDFGETVEGGLARVFFTFPRSGRYLVGVDFMTEAQGSQDKQFVVEVEGAPVDAGPEAKALPGLMTAKLAEDDSYTEPALLQAIGEGQAFAVSLQQPDTIRAGEEATFTYRFTKDGEPLTDLRHYLEAPLHLAVVKDDLTAFLHTHGTLPADGRMDHGGHGSAGAMHANAHAGPDTFGPEIEAAVTFPEPGTYYLFAQAAHGDQLLTSRFPIHVE